MEVPLLWWSRQCLWSSRSSSLSTVVDISTVSQRPSWCRRCSCGYGRRCVHAATVYSTVCERLVVLRGGVRNFQQLCYGGDQGLFRRILRHFFSRSSGCPGVECQFFELSSAHNCECSRAPGSAGVAGESDSQVTSHRDCQFMLR